MNAILFPSVTILSACRTCAGSPHSRRNRDDSSHTRFDEEMRVTSKKERQDYLAREREDIAARIAKFKATQDRFTRDREEYAESTLQKAWLKAWSKEPVG
jgi:hypothetical protein